MSGTVANEVVIRMYDVGFGDSFLLRFPSPDRTRHLKVLIDCGTFAKGDNELRDVVRSIIASATEDGGKACLDVVIATHRHKDHVDAFRLPEWETVAVKEVWMPWTEEPDDEDARRLRLAQERTAARLTRALAQLGATAAAAADVVALALKNEAAMQMLWSGFAGKPKKRYLPPKGDLPYMFRSEALPGVGIHVLGPSRDEEVIRDLKPPDGQSYLWGVAVGGGDEANPFSREVLSYLPAQFGRLRQTRHLALSKDLRTAVKRANDPLDPLAIAAQLDGVINGTSLMLVFKVGKATLLFPGDAQWGTWQMVLDNPDSLDLVRQADFYKVSHHASHNGTPVDFVEKHLKRSSRAMISVRPFSRWPDIPRKPLEEELSERCKGHVVRSDKAKKSPEDAWYTLGEDDYAKYVETRIKC
jgi:beta-lactamase superfamily II metal-dependent hydrolase